ncbi:glycosyltransferase [Subtercola boreus]|uniref:glycosyltransferase n=1 Tax=Subtercola boreus TaxID=120213 RepID=UPI0015596721|nr:glycosyltransferase [Subtercola boreus]
MTTEQTLPSRGRRRSSGAVDSIAIVIPARNEEELIGRCLGSIDAAVARARATLTDDAPHIVTVVVVDSSHDGTEAIAAGFTGVSVLTIDAQNVGEARRAGIDLALTTVCMLGHRDTSRVWIANTDADSAVPEHWLLTQLDLAEQGADVMVGTVRPDFADLTPAQTAAWLALNPAGEPGGHIHGANLGLRANLYQRVGRFAALTEHEDVDLLARLEAQDARIVSTTTAEVLTSGRQAGRTPGGFAGYLRTELIPPS